MDWTHVVFVVVAVALIAWALVGLWISTFRKEPPLPAVTKDAFLQLARLVEEEIVAVGTWQSRMNDRVRVLEAAGDHQALDKRFTALADRVTAIELAVKALRERTEEQGESSDEDPKPSELAWRALTLIQREIELEGKAHAVTPTPAVEPASITEAARARARRWIRATDNRHPATENDPGRGSATADKS